MVYYVSGPWCPNTRGFWVSNLIQRYSSNARVRVPPKLVRTVHFFFTRPITTVSPELNTSYYTSNYLPDKDHFLKIFFPEWTFLSRSILEVVYHHLFSKFDQTYTFEYETKLIDTADTAKPLQHSE